MSGNPYPQDVSLLIGLATLSPFLTIPFTTSPSHEGLKLGITEVDMSGKVGKHGYERYYSGVVYKTVYHNEFKGGDTSYIRHNVMLLTTTVHGRIVYCLDILAGEYKHF